MPRRKRKAKRAENLLGKKKSESVFNVCPSEEVSKSVEETCKRNALLATKALEFRRLCQDAMDALILRMMVGNSAIGCIQYHTPTEAKRPVLMLLAIGEEEVEAVKQMVGVDDSEGGFNGEGKEDQEG